MKKQQQKKQQLPKPVTLDDIRNLSAEIPIILKVKDENGVMKDEFYGYLTSKFLREDYYQIFERFPLLDYDILYDDNGMPVIDEVKKEPKKDYNNPQITLHNKRQELKRMASMIKLMGREMCWTDDEKSIEELDEKDIVLILSDLPGEIFDLLNQKINECVQYKFHHEEQIKQTMLKRLLAVSHAEKKINDSEEDRVKQKIERLEMKNKNLHAQLKLAKDKELIEKLENDIKKTDEEILKLYKLLPNKNEEVSYRNGIRQNACMIKISQLNHWRENFTMKVLFDNLTEREHLYVQMCLTDYYLNNASEREEIDKMKDNQKNGNKGNGKRARGD